MGAPRSHRATSESRVRPSSPLYLVALCAILGAALLAHLRVAGTSPVVWMDTFNDQVEVRRCIEDDACTLTGVQTSIRGLYAAVSWLDLRTLAAWSGASLDQVHLTVILLNALAVVLVFHLASLLGGGIAGSLAALFFIARLDDLVPMTALHNSVLLFALGAVLVIACTALALRPGIASVTLAALVAAIMANTHLVCLVTGVSVVALALTAPRHRLPLAALGGGVFALATIAIAPTGWLENAIALLQSPGARTTATIAGVDTSTMGGALFGVVAWAAALGARSPAWKIYRRRVDGAVAVVAPLLIVFLGASLLGTPAEAKYLFHIKAAVALAAALPIAAALTAAARALGAARALPLVEALAPFVAAIAIALPGVALSGNAVAAAQRQTPTVGDLVKTVQILGGELGWSPTQLLRQLKSPSGNAVLTGALQLAGHQPRTAAGDSDARTTAFLLVLRSSDLPRTVPSTWRILRRSTNAATVLVLARSPIDWSDFEVCTSTGAGAQQCRRGEWQYSEVTGIYVSGMPPGGSGWRGELRLRLRMYSAEKHAPAVLFLPRSPLECGGSVLSTSEGSLEVDSSRRLATLDQRRTTAHTPSTIEIAWNVGSRVCAASSYAGLPPFFIEGDRASVGPLVAALRAKRGGL